MIVNYLRSHHTYSLTFDPGKGDPLTNFILADKGAHCEYFASAAVILLRCAGVPARYVTGYYAHEAASDGTITVRQRDAHAWAEAWLPDTGWITVDATPESGMPDVAGEPIPWWTSLTEWIQDKWAAFRAWAGDLSPMQQVEIVLAFSVFAIALQWLRVLRQKKKKMAVEIDYAIPDRALADLAERFERWLGEMQVPCPKNRTWGEHLSHLSHNQHVPREFDIGLVAEFVRRFASIRFGSPDDRAAIAALAVDFEKLTVRKN